MTNELAADIVLAIGLAFTLGSLLFWVLEVVFDKVLGYITFGDKSRTPWMEKFTDHYGFCGGMWASLVSCLGSVVVILLSLVQHFLPVMTYPTILLTAGGVYILLKISRKVYGVNKAFQLHVKNKDSHGGREEPANKYL